MERVKGVVLRRTELDDLREIARAATRSELENYEPISEEWSDKLVLGTLFDGDDRVFELYVPQERPQGAIVITSARVNRHTKAVSVIVTNLKRKPVTP